MNKRREIAVFHEKDGDICYDIEASGGFDRVCYAVFQRRGQQGVYPTTPPEEPQMPEVEKPANAGDAKEAVATWMRYEQALKMHPFNCEQWKLLEEARQGSLEAAQTLIEIRREHAYEGYTLHALWTVDSETVPAHIHPKREQVHMLATLLLFTLGSEAANPLPPEKVEKRNEYLADVMARLTRTRVGRPVHPATLEDSQNLTRILAALRNIMRDPGNLWVEDGALRVLDKIGFDYDRGEIERHRVERFGGVEAVAKARFEARFGRPYEGEADAEHLYYVNKIVRDSKDRLGIE